MHLFLKKKVGQKLDIWQTEKITSDIDSKYVTAVNRCMLSYAIIIATDVT